VPVCPQRDNFDMKNRLCPNRCIVIIGEDSEVRIFIQFDHEDKRDVIGKWHRSILGNTSARDVMKEAGNDGVIIRNVPLYVSEVSIKEEIAKSFGREVKVIRMRRRDQTEV